MKKRISGEIVVSIIFVGLLAFLIIFGAKITGYAVSESTSYKIDIEMENTYVPGEEISFKMVLYDENNNKIEGEIDFYVRDYYSDIIEQGQINSGQEKTFKLSENAIQGPWAMTAFYNDVEVTRLFTIEKLEKAEINLEEDNLVIKNIGNTVYEKEILIYIGNNDQTAKIYLEVGQIKRIKLTAPDGEYKIKVISDDISFEIEGVSLTGNVIGLERVLENGFWKKYPMVSLFLGAVGFLVIIITVLKLHDKFG